MRIGFIGGSGHHYLKGALKDPALAGSVEAAFAGDGRDEARARKAAQALGGAGARWYDDARKMLDEFRPDVVNVGAVYAYNGEWAAACLERGLPVVSDKPVAATWAQLERLRSLCRCGPRVLLTEFDFRSRAEIRAARQAVQEGRLGEIVLATAQKSYRWGERPAWYRNRADYGGTLLWIASHGIDAIHFVTGRKFTSVWGRQGNVARPDWGAAEDHTVSVLGLEGGGTGVVHADFLRPAKAATHGDDRLRVAGSRGLLEVREGRCKLICHDQPEEDITERGKPEPTHRELLAAARGESNDLYSTEASLYLAEVLLYARDAGDEQRVVKIW